MSHAEGVADRVHALPSGDVTFVFTDMEGSTRLLRALGEQYAGVLDRHRQILEAAAVAEGGVIVDAEGDALFLAFDDAAAALRACVRGHQELAEEQWPDGVQVRVRIGVHTGAAAPVDGHYASLAVHEAARIAASAHGGQVVLSDATLEAADDMTFGVLRDLGQHYLKDFDEPIRLWQLTAPGAPAAFPDLRTGGARLPLTGTGTVALTGVPTQWTTFIGRDDETRTAAAALAAGPLVTLVGPGGVGKTRLAIEVGRGVATEYEHGGVFVELVPVRPGFLVQAVAAALAVAGRAGQALEDSVIERLAPRHALLVLDNCEHVLAEVAGFAARILAGCPRVGILATSRERLGIPGERLVVVPPLTTAAAAERGADPSEATRLFVERALAADPQFDEDVAGIEELCARLDGMPLAIELAAARAGSLGVPGVLAGLGDQLRLLAGGRSADERHRSLRSVLDWSYGLLDDEERQFLHRLGMFVSGFDLAAAAEVAADGDAAAAADLLGRLADKSLVVRQRGSVPRWRLLETVRTYALDKLIAAGDEAATRARHLAWAGHVAHRLEAQLAGDARWREEFDAVADDLRAAIAVQSDAETVYSLAMATARIVFAHRFYEEAQAHLERAAAVAPDAAAAVVAVRAAADVCQANVRTDAALERLQRAAELAAVAGDDSTRAICLAQAVVSANRFPAGAAKDIAPARLAEMLDLAQRVAPPGDAHVQAYLAQAAAWRASAQTRVLSVDPRAAEQALAAAREVQDPVLISGALDAVLADLLGRGRMKAGFAIAKERMTNLALLSRHDPRASVEMADTLHMLNEQALAAGELPTALREMRKLQQEELPVFVGFSAASRLLGSLVLTGALEEATERADEMWGGWLAAGSPTARWMASGVLGAGLAAALRGDQAAADEWLQRAQRTIGKEDMFKHRNSSGAATFVVARRDLHAGRYTAAAEWTRAFGANAGEWYVADSRWTYDAYVWALDAELAVLAQSADVHARLAAARPAAQENHWAAACLDRAQGRLDRDHALLQRSISRWERIDARFERACTLLLLPDRAGEGRSELAAIGATVPA